MNSDVARREMAATLLGVAQHPKARSGSDSHSKSETLKIASLLSSTSTSADSQNKNKNQSTGQDDSRATLPPPPTLQTLQQQGTSTDSCTTTTAQQAPRSLIHHRQHQPLSAMHNTTATPLTPTSTTATATATTTTSTTTTTTTASTTHQRQPASSESASFLSMSSIGFGIDSSPSSQGDATEACLRALQDAMVRSTLRLPMVTTSAAQNSLQINIQLGVPPKYAGSPESMFVDTARLRSALPTGVPVMPVGVGIGGLFIQGEAEGAPSICTAVACITLQQQSNPTILPPEPSSSSPSRQSQPQLQHPPHHQQNIPATTTTTTLPSMPLNEQLSSQEYSQAKREEFQVQPRHPNTYKHNTDQQSMISQQEIPQVPISALEQKSAVSMQAISPKLGTSNRNNSIDVLAMISEEIRLAVENGRATTAPSSIASHHHQLVHYPSKLLPSGQQSNGHHSAPTPSTTTTTTSSSSSSSHNLDSTLDEAAQLRNGTYNYQKLPPGLTMKNNQRLFVKHSYRDFSNEQPLPEERDLLRTTSSPTTTVTASTNTSRESSRTFPLKLHDTLTQIEMDGLSNIIGWLPHGRSFRIFKQKEFAEIILPQYFVMTKKSSFLRQLNLYGFNRFSAGPDQGSYYHEKFLRGMTFLCRRMTRQKVNGNRIRSAGNPDEEPTLSNYPSCPPLSSK